MTTSFEQTAPGEQSDSTQRWLPAMLALFVGSGCAALIYEVVWLQLLQLSVGSSAVSLGVLLGVFMGGMCLGSVLLPKFISPKHHPLRVYAYLELGIGAFGLLILFGIPLLGGVYNAVAGTGGASVFLRAIVAGICLLPPTLLMGATLPAIARWVKTTPAGVSWLGYFYGGNIAGAVMGSLAAGFYLLRVYDMPTATFVAVAINVAVALLALGIAGVTPHTSNVENRAPGAAPVTPASRLVYWAIGLSGLTALGSEVVWARILSLLFGATTYTFSLILAVFLVGLGIGSTLGAGAASRSRNPRAALGWCQLGLCATIAWAAYAASASLPYWPINPSLIGNADNIAFNFQLDLMRAIWVMLPAAILWGASFPFALAAIATPGQDSGRLVGSVYAANTLGAIVGAVGTSWFLLGNVGSGGAQQVMIGLALVSGLLMLVPPMLKAQPVRAVGVTAGALIAGSVLLASVPALPGMLVAYGRYAATWLDPETGDPINQVIYSGEGVTAAVAVSRTPYGVLNYHNAGKVQASSEPQDMRLQRMLGHMTTLVPENPSKVLVIGCGAGVTAGAVSIDPAVTDETIAEIEPLVPYAVSTYFAEHNFDVIANPKVTVHLDDARHFLLTTDEMFDAITSDPLDPWVKGAATLYTREFFEEVRAHLNPGGVVTLFVQLYESTEEAVKSEVGTFLEVFPDGVVFANTTGGQGYDLVLLGRLDDEPIDLDRIEARLRAPENEAVARSLGDIGIYSAVDLFGTYAGSVADMGSWLADAQINRDLNLRLQYLAGLGLNQYDADRIYRNMVAESQYPEGLFTGSPETLDAVRQRISQAMRVSGNTNFF